MNREIDIDSDIKIENAVYQGDEDKVIKHILIDGEYAIATNEVVMVVNWMDIPFDGKALLPVEALLHDRKENFLTGLHIDSGGACTTSDGKVFDRVTQDAKDYPDWRNAVKFASGKAVFQINVAVKQLRKILDIVENDDVLHLEFTGERGAIRVYDFNQPNFFGIIMPVDNKHGKNDCDFTEHTILNSYCTWTVKGDDKNHYQLECNKMFIEKDKYEWGMLCPECGKPVRGV